MYRFIEVGVDEEGAIFRLLFFRWVFFFAKSEAERRKVSTQKVPTANQVQDLLKKNNVFNKI